MSLLERERESASLRGLVADVVGQRGGCLIVEGQPGVGKSALLTELAAVCRDAGAAVCVIHATPLGQQIPFGVARRLLDPLVRAHPASLQAGWARHARSLFDGDLDQLATGAPLLEGLVALVAQLTQACGPLMLVVDDAQWIDQSSLAFLGELCLRRAEIGAGVAVGLSTTVPELDLGPLRQLGTPGSILLRPAQLSTSAVEQLAAERLPGAGGEFVARLAHASAGNPRLAIEMLDLALRSGVSEPLVPARLAHELALSLDDLSDAARALATAVAVLEEAPLRRAAVLANLDPPAADRAADELVARHLLTGGEPISYQHPVSGTALAASLPPFERAALHRRAAELLAAEHEPDDVVAEHLMRSRPGAEAWVSDVLRAAGRAALLRGEPAGASRLLERAAAEAPEAEGRNAVLLELAAARAAAGQPAAIESFEHALAHITEPSQRGEAWHRLSRLLYARGEFAGAAAAGARGQSELALGDTLRERLLQDEIAAAELVDELRAGAAGRLRAMIAGDPPADPGLLAYVLSRQAFSGVQLERIPALAEQALASDPLVDPTSHGWALMFVATALNLTDHAVEASNALDRGLERATELGDLLTEVTLRCCRAWTWLLRGRLDLAGRDLDAVLAVNSLGWPMVDSICSLPLIVLRLELGDLAGARDAAQRIPTAGIPGRAYYDGAIAYAEGDSATALVAFEAAGLDLEQVHGVQNPGVLPWRSGAALAAAQLGRRDRAVALATVELEQARAAGLPRALGIALRTLGRVVREPHLIDESIAVLETSPARLELARSLLAAGTARRRAQRPAEARTLLDRAHQLAVECGSGPLADQAIGELRATGARPRDRPRLGVAALTPSQRRVTELAAEGRTTRQVAAELFLSPKTVEGHLTAAFRTLGISSRAELRPLLEAAGDKAS